MRTSVNPHFALALKEFKTAVTVCCWIIGLALMVQLVCWSLLSFTESRWETVQKVASGEPSVVTPEVKRREALRNVDPDGHTVQPVDINRQTSKLDRVMHTTTNVFASVGTMASLALLPFIGLGVILAASSGTRGIERTSGAFVWAVVLVTIVIPWGAFFESIPFAGMFPSYNTIANDADFWNYGTEYGARATVTSSGMLFWARYALLPLGAIAGVAAIGLRFAAGVHAGLMHRESLRLDPELEQEISKIKTGSLVGGGRTAGALQNTIQPDAPSATTPDSGRSIRQVSPGEAPRRLI